MHRRVAFLLFTAGWGANHFATLLVVYRKELGLSPSALGLLFGAYAVGLVPGLLLAGRAADAVGRRALVLPASVLAIVASAVLAFGARGFGVLLAGRLLYGVAMGAVMSPGSVWIQELSPPEAGPRRATLALSAGFGFGPLASGVLGELAPAPMMLPYAAHAAVMALAVVAVRPVPETAPRAQRKARGFGLGRPTVGLLVALLPVAPWAFGLAAITGAIVPGLMRPYVTRPVLYSAFVIMMTLLSGVSVQPLTTRIGRKADLVGLAVGAMGAFVAAHAVAGRSPVLVVVAGLLVGAGYGLVTTTGLREVAEQVSPDERGTAVGIYYVLTYVGFGLPLVHALAAKSLGDAATLRFTALGVLASLVVRALVSRRRADG